MQVSCYFFSFNNILLNEYRAKGEADPRSIANIKYKYSHKTAHDGLRTHLENHHYDEYMEGVAQGKWALWLKKKRRELAKESEANQGQEVVKSAPFSVDNVTHCLADFIAADDQVCPMLF
jgi:hypothetical protein